VVIGVALTCFASAASPALSLVATIHDPRDLFAESASTPYDSWLVRQYRVNQPRSLIAHCHGLTWRWVSRAPVASQKLRFRGPTSLRHPRQARVADRTEAKAVVTCCELLL